MGESTEPVTQILEAVGGGDAQAAEKLLPLVYNELRKLAAQKMANEAPGQTLQPTALVHEVWLRLAHQSRSDWKNREQFYAVASEVMRRILVDRARRQSLGEAWRRPGAGGPGCRRICRAGRRCAGLASS